MNRSNHDRSIRSQHFARNRDKAGMFLGRRQQLHRHREVLHKPDVAQQAIDKRGKIGRGFDKLAGAAQDTRPIGEVGLGMRLVAGL